MKDKKSLDKQILNKLKEELQFDFTGVNVIETKEVEIVKKKIEGLKNKIFSLFNENTEKESIEKEDSANEENVYEIVARDIVSKRVNLILDSMIEDEEIFELSQETKQTINEMILQPLEKEIDKESER